MWPRSRRARRCATGPGPDGVRSIGPTIGSRTAAGVSASAGPVSTGVVTFGSCPWTARSAGSRPGRTHPRPVRRQVVAPIRRSGAADFFGDHKCGSTTTRPRARARHHDPHSAGRDRHAGGAGGRRAGRDAERSGTDRRAPGSRGAPGGTGAHDGGRCGTQSGGDDRGHAPWRDRPGRLSRRHVVSRCRSPCERGVQGSWMLGMAAGPVARCRPCRWARCWSRATVQMPQVDIGAACLARCS